MIYKKLTFICLVFLFCTSNAHCEYRVYQYFVKSKFKLPYDSEAYLVTSSLDPVSYISYHGGQDSIKINLLRTWMCKGNTSKNKYCDPPAKKIINN